MVHDELNQQTFEWRPEWQSSYEQYGELDGRGISNWDGLLLNGWRPIVRRGWRRLRVCSCGALRLKAMRCGTHAPPAAAPRGLSCARSPGFAQPDGKRGSMTRTWFRVKDRPIFAWAGFCRNSDLWGPVYGAMTTGSNSAVAPLNPRMPVILAPDEHDRWLEGSAEDVIDFQLRSPLPSERE